MSCSPVCLFHQDQQELRKSQSVVAKFFSARAASGPRSPRTSASHWRLRRSVLTKALEFLDVVLYELFVQVSKTGLRPLEVPRTHRGPRCRIPAGGTGDDPASREPTRERPLLQEARFSSAFGSLAPGKTAVDTWRRRTGAASRIGYVQTGGQGALLLRRFDAPTTLLQAALSPLHVDKGAGEVLLVEPSKLLHLLHCLVRHHCATRRWARNWYFAICVP